MRNNTEGNRLANWQSDQGQKMAINRLIPADNHVFDINSPPYTIMAPAGAVDILLPASNAQNEGKWFIITNNSANVVTFKTSGDAAFTTAIVLAAQETTMIICTGDATAALGWRAIGTASSA
jgi:hypothetical protein